MGTDSVSAQARRTRLVGVLLLTCAFFSMGDACQTLPVPKAGLPEYQQIAAIRVPGGLFNTAGGNLLLPRTDLAISTKVGMLSVGRTYNGVGGTWRWSQDVTYAGGVFTDASGWVQDISAISSGAPIPGTIWIKVDSDTLKTKGGLIHDFGTDGRLASVYWSSARYPSWEYRTVQAGRTDRIEQCAAAASCTTVVQFGYNGSGQLTSLSDWASRSVTYEYLSGQLSLAKGALDNAKGYPGERYTYLNGLIRTILSSENVQVQYTFASYARLAAIQQIGEGDPTWTLGYVITSGAPVTQIHDPDGFDTYYAFTTSFCLRAIQIVSTGEATQIVWTGLRPTQVIKPDGNAESMTWVNDVPATITDSALHTTTIDTYAGGVNRANPGKATIAEVRDSLGVILHNDYDAAGRLWKRTNGANETATLAYLGSEDIASVTPPTGVAMVFSNYAAHGQPGTIDIGGNQDLRTYDALGRLQKGIDFDPQTGPSLGAIRSRTFDQDGNVDSIILDIPAATISIPHRSDGQPIAIYRPYGADATFDYDVLGRLKFRCERANGAYECTTFEYNKRSMPTSMTRSNGMRIQIQYDAAGREEIRTAKRNNTIESVVTSIYEGGRLTSRLDSTYGSTGEAYEYDDYGRLERLVYPGGESIQLGFDARSRVSSQTYWMPSAAIRTIGREYDGAGREKRVLDNGSEVLKRTYAQGRLQEIKAGNGINRVLGYDPTSGALTGITGYNSSQQVIETTTLDVSVWGPQTSNQLVSVRQVVTATGSFGGQSSMLSWEQAGVFVSNLSAPVPVPWAVDGAMISFAPTTYPVFPGEVDGPGSYKLSFDSLANVSEREFDTPNDTRAHWYYDRNAEHTRLTQVRRVENNGVPPVTTIPYTYQYDTAGFVTNRNGVTFQWTATGRIKQMGSDTAVWDGSGRLVQMVMQGQLVKRRFGGQVEADSAGNPTTIDLGHTRISLATGAHKYLHADLRGNVKFTSDDSGQYISFTYYHAYGSTGTYGDQESKKRFAQGTEIDDLVVLGERLYDQATGVFLQPDPEYNPINQYSYASLNPVLFWDGSGSHTSIASAGIINTAFAFVDQIALPTFGGVTGYITTELLIVYGVGPAAILVLPVEVILLRAVFRKDIIDKYQIRNDDGSYPTALLFSGPYVAGPPRFGPEDLPPRCPECPGRRPSPRGAFRFSGGGDGDSTFSPPLGCGGSCGLLGGEALVVLFAWNRARRKGRVA